MEKIISIEKKLGKDLRTRSFFRRDIEGLIEKDDTEVMLDFSGVIFVSRSVADEIYNLLLDYPNMKIRGLAGDVDKMYNVVKNGRMRPREYPADNVRVVHLKTMKELVSFFAAL